MKEPCIVAPSGHRSPLKPLTKTPIPCGEPLACPHCRPSREKASRVPAGGRWTKYRPPGTTGQVGSDVCRMLTSPHDEKTPQRNRLSGCYQATWPKRNRSQDRAMCQEKQKACPFISTTAPRPTAPCVDYSPIKCGHIAGSVLWGPEPAVVGGMHAGGELPDGESSHCWSVLPCSPCAPLRHGDQPPPRRASCLLLFKEKVSGCLRPSLSFL